MFIFLYGEDTYRSVLKLREIVDGYKKVHKTGLNLIYFDCANADFKEFRNSAQSISMFQERKLIILEQGFLNTIFKEKFLEWASMNLPCRGAAPAGSIIVIYEKQALKKTDKLFKFLKSNARTQEFNFLAGARLQDWVDAEFQKYGAKIEWPARAKLIDFVGSDLWQMSQEIRKLCAYAGAGVEIPASDVDLLVMPKINTDIFKTIDAIAQNNKASALRLLHKHLEKGDAPLYLLSMINFQFRNLISVKDYLTRVTSPCRGAPPSCGGRGDAAISAHYGAARIPGMHPYTAQKSIAQARNFTFDKLKKIYYKLFAIDSEIKTGKIDPQMALDMLVIQI